MLGFQGLTASENAVENRWCRGIVGMLIAVSSTLVATPASSPSQAAVHQSFDGNSSRSVQFGGDGLSLLAAGEDEARMLDVPRLALVGGPLRPKSIEDCELVRHGASVFLAVSGPPNSDFLDLSFLDARTLRSLAAPLHVGDLGMLYTPRPSADGRFVALGDEPRRKNAGSNVQVLDTTTCKFIFAHHFGDHLATFRPSTNGQRLLVIEWIGAHRTRTSVWNVATGKTVCKPIERDTRWEEVVDMGWNLSATFSPDGKRFAIAYGDGAVVYDATTGDAALRAMDPARVDPGRLPCNAVDFTPDGSRLVTIRDSVRAWDLATGKRTDAYLSGSEMCTHSMSADGNRFAYTRINDPLAEKMTPNGLGVIDLRSGAKLLSCPDEWHVTVAISPDGKKLAAGSEKDVWIFDVP